MRKTPSRRPAASLLRDTRGSAVEKVFLLAAFVFVAVAGLSYLAKSTNQTLNCQGKTIANRDGTFSCGEGATVANSAPASALGPVGQGPMCSGRNCMCFVAGTPVVTASGLQAIETIQPGTLVLSRVDDGAEIDWKPVVRTFVSRSRSLIQLASINADGRTETLRTTGNHPFYAEGRGWVDARTLVPGQDLLVDRYARPLAVRSAESLDEQVTVYNLEVADFHTYFVGETGIWVHNTATAPDGAVGSQRLSPSPAGDDEPLPEVPAPNRPIRRVPRVRPARPPETLPLSPSPVDDDDPLPVTSGPTAPAPNRPVRRVPRVRPSRPPPSDANPPPDPPVLLDPDWLRTLNDKPYFDHWTYQIAKWGSLPAAVAVDHLTVFGFASEIRASTLYAWNLRRFKKYGDELSVQYNELLDLSQHPEQWGEADPDITRAIINYTLTQVNRRVNDYHRTLQDGEIDVASAWLPAPVGPIVGGAKFLTRTAPRLAHAVAKQKSKLPWSSNKGEYGKASGITRKTAALLILDEAYLANSKPAQIVVQILFGPDVARRIGEQWGAITKAANEGGGDADPAEKRKVAERVEQFITEFGPKIPQPTRQLEGHTTETVAATVARESVTRRVGQLGRRILRQPASPEQQLPERITLVDGPSLVRGDHSDRPSSVPLKAYDSAALTGTLGATNVDPGGVTNFLRRKIPTMSYQQFPDKLIVSALADRLAATIAPRKPIEGSPDSTSPGPPSSPAQPPPPNSPASTTSTSPVLGNQNQEFIVAGGGGGCG